MTFPFSVAPHPHNLSAHKLSLNLACICCLIFDMAPTAKVARTDCADAASQGKVADERLEKERYQKSFFEKLTKACEDRDAEGSIVIQGIDRRRDEDDDEDDGEEVKEKSIVYTKEELDSLRYIVVTKSRRSFLDKAMKMASAGYGNTAAGNDVIWNIIPWVNKAKKQKTLPLKFDAMFALTYALFYNDVWMHDNELYGEGDDLDKSVQALGKYWATLLVHTDAELGIDSEFTRPGILSLLGQFKEEVESTGAFEECKPFKWTK